jgi:Phosphotransferase enzyme family
VSLSPIELLLPKGFARGAIVLGSACPSVLVPASAGGTANDAPVDLVVLAPSKAERRDREWIDSATRTAGSRLSREGIAYVVPARASELRRALAGRGLHAAQMLFHVPDVSRSRHVFPVGTLAERYAVSGRLPLKRVKRLAASTALRWPRAAALGPTGAIQRRDSSTPLAQWLFTVAPTAPGSVLLTTRRAPSGGSVLHRFAANGSEPDAVAKVSSRVADEVRGLAEIAPAAARAGVQVPEVLWSGELGPAQALVETALGGEVAAHLIERGRLDPVVLHGRLAGWLDRWARSTAAPRRLQLEDLDHFLLLPATRLAGRNTSYLDYLDGLCARAVGSVCSFVPAHGDLTATNILVDDRGELGILDWEEAAEARLPLTDFFYAAADVVAAAGGYSDRPGSVRACFGTDGERTTAVRQMANLLGDGLELDLVVRELCFHACWLHHAANEATAGSDPRHKPFESILMDVADDPRGFASALFGRR